MRILFYSFIVWILFFGFACHPEKTASKTTIPSKIEDTIEESSDNVIEELDEKIGFHSPTVLGHNPKVLIQRLGNLNDRTVANIGAGPYGYFSFYIADKAKKVIAIDIDPKAIHFIDSLRLQFLPTALQDRLETRLVLPDNPKLRFEEADIVTIRETYAYLPNRIQYLKNLKRGIKDGGKLLIVDFKMRKLPVGPPQSEKIPLYQVEQDLEEAGYKIILVDDNSFAYQYMLLAEKE